MPYSTDAYLGDLVARYARVERGEEDLHGYQETGVEFLFDCPFSGLFMDTGLGKTGTVLTYISRLLMRFMIQKRVLIVAPIRVVNQTWPNEIPIWQHTAWLNFQVIRAEDDEEEVAQAGKDAAVRAKVKAQAQCDDLIELGSDVKDARKYRDKIVQRAAGRARTAKKEELRQKRRNSPATIHLINGEQLEWLVDQYCEWKTIRRRDKSGRIVEKRVRKAIKDWPYEVVIVDDVSFKEHSTARFKAMTYARMKGGVERMHILTATPASENYLGIFPQIFLLDLGKRLGRGITAYRDRYFDANEYNHTYKIKPGAKEEISELISDICLVMKSGDYLDEEDPLFLPRRLLMEAPQMAMYKQMERDLVLELPEGVVEAKTAANLSQKLLQLASGFIYHNDSKEWSHFHDEKIDDLRQLVEELDGEPLLVSYWYKPTLERLKKAFPKAAVMDKKGDLVHAWNRGELPFLLMNPAGTAHGLNMQYGPGHDLYGYDLPWSFDKFYQLYRRLARQGQKKRVRVHMPQMIDTHDQHLVSTLAEKRDAQDVLFERIKALRAAFRARARA